jgi:hypothetical protein
MAVILTRLRQGEREKFVPHRHVCHFRVVS